MIIHEVKFILKNFKMAESVALVGVHGGQKAAEWRESSLVCELWKLHLLL